MRKDPVVDDYAGSNYGSRGRNKRTGQLSFRCDSCGTLRYVNKRELSRAAQPRCLACGGCLLETDATEKKEKSDNKNYGKDLKRERNARRCRECGWILKTNEDVMGHLETKLDCRESYIDSALKADCRWFQENDARRRKNDSMGELMAKDLLVIPATVIIGKPAKRPHRALWRAEAMILEPGNRIVRQEIFCSSTRTAVHEWIRDQFGPVNLAR